jgi:GTP-binding protein Era
MTSKFGYVAISGPTNSGKSTLINTIFNKKISIVSHKFQTTTKSLDAVKNINKTQIVFIDTPGFYEKKFDANYYKDVLGSISRAHILMIVLDATSRFKYLYQIEKIIKNFKNRKFLIINKIDLVDNDYILKKINQITFINSFDDVFYISALKKKNIDIILKKIQDFLPIGKWIYNKNTLTNISKQEFLEEITRESILKYLNQEIPYNISISTDQISKKKSYNIYQKITVLTLSHKKIILGKDGRTIKLIGSYARLQMEKILKYKCNLFLKVILKKK